MLFLQDEGSLILLQSSHQHKAEIVGSCMVHIGWLLKYILGKDKEQIEFTRDKPYLYSLIAKVGHIVVGVLKVVIPFFIYK